MKTLMKGLFLLGCILVAAIPCYVVARRLAPPPEPPPQYTDLDCSCTKILDEFNDDPSVDALLRHLCASSVWGVTRWRNLIRAERRSDKPRTADEWFVLDEKKRNHIGVALTFVSTAQEGHQDRASGKYVSFGGPGDPKVNLAVRLATDASRHLVSSTVIEGKRIVLAITEGNLEIERTLTKEAMRQVCEELAAIKQNLAVVTREGYLRQWLPKGSIRESVDDLPIVIQDGWCRGIYWVSGYVNPQEKGYITIRTYVAGTGQQLAGGLNGPDGPDTVEYVGWSEKRTEKYFFESELTLAGDGETNNVRFEVWFHGKTDRKLLETTKLLWTWTR